MFARTAVLLFTAVTIFLRVSLRAQAPAQPPLTGSETGSWSGTLFETARTDCAVAVADSGTPGTCPVSICTPCFGIRLPDGKLYRFDEESNPKVADALGQTKKGSRVVYDYLKSGNTVKPVSARVTDHLASDTLNLENVKVD